MKKSIKAFLFLSFITLPISITFAAPVVESVAISGDKLIVTGHQFLDIDGLILSDPQTGFKKPFKVESATESEIVGTAVDNQKITVASLMNLIIDTAKGETTYPVSFSLQKDAVTNPTIKNGAITPEKFVGVTTPNPPDQSVLTWDEPTQSFIFTSSSGGSGSSGVSDIVLGTGITGAPNTASGSVPISVDIGATGSTSKTKIPYFNSKNKIVLDSTTSPVGSLTGLSFKDGTQNFYMFNDNGLRINSNVASDLLVLSVDGNLSLKGPVTVGGYDVCLSSGNCTSAPSGTSTVTATAPLIAATTSTGTTNISAGAVNTANNLVQLDAAGKFPVTIPGVVRGPGSVSRSATSGNVAIFSDTTGENLGDSGIGLQNLPSMSATPTTANKMVISTGANKALGTTAYTVPNTSGVTGQVLGLTATNTVGWINGSGVTSFNTRTGAVIPQAGDYSADQVTNLPLGIITATNVQQAIDQLANLDSQKLPLSGGTMTGTINTTTQNAISVGPYASGTGEIRFFEISTVEPFWVGFKAPLNIDSPTVWTLPAADGTSGQVLSTNGLKVLSWITAGAGGIGDVVGPATSTLNNLATFSGATGKNIKDSGINSGNLPTMATAATAANKIIISAGPSKQLTTTLYPIPPAIGASGTVLKSDGTNVTWQPDSGGAGNVVGPATSAANALAQFSDTTGKIIKGTAWTVPSTVGTTNQVLKSNGTNATWQAVGDVAGPATSTANMIAAFSDTTGKKLSSYGVGINSSNDLWGVRIMTLGSTGSIRLDAFNNRVGIGGGAALHILQLDSTDSGFLPPRMTTAQKNAIPSQTTGLVIYDTDLNALSVRSPSGWTPLKGGDVVGPAVATVANRPALYANTTGKLLTEAPYTLPITAGTTGQVLGLTGTGIAGWVNSGNVAGAATSTTNAISKYSDTTGKNLINTGVLINATNDISGIEKLTSTGDMVVDTNTLKVDATNNRVGIGTASPSQVFQIDSTTSGFLPPRMTTAQKDAIVSPPAGLMVYDTSTSALNVRKSSGWSPIMGDVAGPATSTLNNLATFSDGTGKIIKNSGINSGNLTTMSSAATANSQVIVSAGGKQLIASPSITADHLYVKIYDYFHFSDTGGFYSNNGPNYSIYVDTVGVGIGGQRLGGAKLAVTSTDSGFLPPRMTTAQKEAIPTPTPGLIVYDTNQYALNVRNSFGGWSPIMGDVAGPSTSTSFAIAKYNDTTGKKLTNSAVLINAANDISGIAKLTSTGDMVVDTNTFKVDATNNRVGIGTASPSQIFQIDSTTSGFLPPRMTTAQKDSISTQTTGMLVFDTSLNSLSVRNSSGWIPLTGDVAGAATSTTNAIPRFTNTNGKNLSNSGVLINTSNDISGIAKFTSTGDMLVDTNTLKVDAVNHRVGIGTTAPKQIFQIDSTTSGFLPPRMTTAQKDAISSSYAQGMIVFDTGLEDLSVHTGFNGWKSYIQAPPSSTGTGLAYFSDLTGRKLASSGIQTNSMNDLTGIRSFSSTGNFFVDNKTFYVSAYNHKVGIGTTTQHPDHILTIESTTSGFLPPRMTTAQKNAISPQSTGLVVFDTDLDNLNVKTSGGWKSLQAGDVAGPATSTINTVPVFTDSSGKRLSSTSVLINPSTGTFVVGNAGFAALKVDAITNRVGIGTASPSQVFQIDSTTSGFLPPRMTTAQKDAIVTQTPGMVVFDTTLNSLSVRNTIGWVSLSGTALLSENKIDELMDAMKKQQNQITQLTKKIEELEKR